MFTSFWPAELQEVILGGFLISAFSLVGMSVAWAALDRGRRLRSWLPLVGLLVLAALIPAHDLVLAFGVQALTFLAAAAVWSLIRRYRGRRVADSSSPPAAAPLQFSLRESLVLTAVAAMIATEIVPIWRLEEPLAWAEIGAVAGLSTVLAAGVAIAGTMRMLVGALALLCAFEVWVAFRYRWHWLFPLLVGPCVAIWLGLSRIADWRPGRMAREQATAPSQRRRMIARAAATVLGLLIALPAACWYYPLARRVTAPHPPIPEPNGFEQLSERVDELNWKSVSNQAWDEPSADGFRTFVDTQRSELAACRSSLDVSWQVPFYVRNDLVRNGRMRDAARAFQAESRVDAADGRIDEVLEGGLAGVRLGTKLANGNLLLDALVGWAIESTGHGRLLALLPQLNVAQCRRAAEQLERCDSQREPLGATFARDEAWELESGGWFGRLLAASDRMAAPDDAEKLSKNCEACLKKARTANALLRGELAIRAFRLSTGELPESLDRLVPDYLSDVPADPWGDGALKYRRGVDGYLLYSIGADARDDGGLRIPPEDDRSGKPGDTFADTLIRDD